MKLVTIGWASSWEYGGSILVVLGYNNTCTWSYLWAYVGALSKGYNRLVTVLIEKFSSHSSYIIICGCKNGLKDLGIYSSYKLPSPKELEDNSLGVPILKNIINATKSLLQDAHELCSDTSLDRNMTHQRTCIPQ